MNVTAVQRAVGARTNTRRWVAVVGDEGEAESCGLFDVALANFFEQLIDRTSEGRSLIVGGKLK